MPPRKYLKNRCSEIESGGILECLLAILYALISRVKYHHYNKACYRLTKAMHSSLVAKTDITMVACSLCSREITDSNQQTCLIHTYYLPSFTWFSLLVLLK